MPAAIEFYFDFISPYAWLALERAAAFEQEHDARFELRPIVYAILLNETGLTGPAEQPEKRRYLYQDLVRSAQRLGLRVEGPPAHPFRSLEALRLAISQLETPHALSLCVAIARACWHDGKDLSDLATLVEAGAEFGLDADRVRATRTDPEVKDVLRQNTRRAREAGVFGVPTFCFGGELFWGQDRMDALGELVDGSVEPLDQEHIERMLARPRAVDRRGSGTGAGTEP